MESAFGITPELLKAKREEEMNVALVEIQLRDEDSFPALSVSDELTDCVLILHDVYVLDITT